MDSNLQVVICLHRDTIKLVKYEVQSTEEFSKWLKGLRDEDGRARMVVRLRRIEDGNFGDHKSLGGNLSELRIDVGPGYRAYYTVRKSVAVFVLAGGDKSTQSRDIERARELMKTL